MWRADGAAMADRIVITGLGVVSSAGVGRHAFWRQLLREARAAESLEIDLAELTPHLPPRGTAHWSRAAKFVAVAASQAVAQSGLGSIDRSVAGVVLGTSLGSVEAINRFEDEIAAVGPRLVEPMLFANTVHNSPAGLVGILHGLTGLNATLSAGSASTLDAIQYAAGFFRSRRLEVMLVGGVEARSPAVIDELRATGQLVGSPAEARPFSRSSGGLALGEGAAVFVVERADRAADRGAPILGEVAGLAFGSVLPRTSEPDAVEARVRVMRGALAGAGLVPHEVGYVEAAASGVLRTDAHESESLRRVFGGAVPPVAAIKGQLGECFGASDALEIARALGALAEGVIPPTVLTPGDERLVGSLLERPRDASLAHVLVNAFNPVGLVASLVLARWPRSGAV